MNTVSFRVPDNEMGNLIEAVLTLPFLGERKLVIAEGYLALQKDDRIRLSEVLQRKPESSIVVFHEKSDLSSLPKSPLLDLLKKEKFTEEFHLLNEQQAAGFMAEECGAMGLKIEVQACAALFRVHGGDSWALTLELSKLCTLALARQRELITLDMVREHTSPSQEDSVFDFLDACFEGRPKKAVPLLDSLLSSGTNDLQLLSMMGRQVRLLLGVKNFQKEGLTDRFMMAKRLGMHPFPVGKALRSSRSMKDEDLRLSLERILDLEHRIKTGRASSLAELALLAVQGK